MYPKASLTSLIMTPLLLLGFSAFGGPTLDTVQVNSVEDLDTCYSIKPYAQTEKLKEKNNHSWVDEGEIAEACGDKAVALARKEIKNSKKVFEIAESVRRNHRSGASLRIFRVLVDAQVTAEICDTAPLQEAVIEGLSHPADYPSAKAAFSKNSFAIIDKCLKFSQFKQDIKDELEKDNSYVKSNLCPFLKERKVVSNCP